MSDLRAACIHGRYEEHRFEIPDGDWVKWESCPGGREVTNKELRTMVEAFLQTARNTAIGDTPSTVTSADWFNIDDNTG